MSCEDDSSWILELETALSDECSPHMLRNICKGRCFPDNLRSEAWRICLRIDEDLSDDDGALDEIFDLPEQEMIRNDCQKVVERLENDEEDKVAVMSNLESIMTHHCKLSRLRYQPSHGWLAILQPLLPLKFSKAELYEAFNCILSNYVPGECVEDGDPFHLFRLLLLYHDPQLCSLLDTKKIRPDHYALPWFKTLFAAPCDVKVVQALWDAYFLQADPFLLFFIALVILINAKESLMAIKDESREKLLESLSAIPGALVPSDVLDLCSLASYYAVRTPSSFWKEFEHLFNPLLSYPNPSTCPVELNLKSALCMPISLAELLDRTRITTPPSANMEHVRFFLVDCRPAEQYNAGHLSAAFHLEANLMLQEPEAFETAVKALLSVQKQGLAAKSAFGGEHLCFLGSGRETEDRVVYMVVSSFLQRHCACVGMLAGGYKALHRTLQDSLNETLANHNEAECTECLAHPRQGKAQDGANFFQKSSSFFDKLGSALKNKGEEMKGKLVDYITNPSGSESNVVRHVRSEDRGKKPYRNRPSVFAIDDTEENSDPTPMEGSSEEDLSQKETVSIATWLKKPDILASFDCQEVSPRGDIYPSKLLVTPSFLYGLRELPNQKGTALLSVKRSLSKIVKITSRKSKPEVITFKYGVPTGEEFIITDMDKFIIPDAFNATRIIKLQIVKLNQDEESEETSEAQKNEPQNETSLPPSSHEPESKPDSEAKQDPPQDLQLTNESSEQVPNFPPAASKGNAPEGKEHSGESIT